MKFRPLAIVTLVAALAIGTQAQAQVFDCQKLDIAHMTADQVASAQSVCAQNAAQVAQTTAKDVTPEKVREWASIGKDFSTAIVETAKGLGQTANEFLFTPVGIMIAFYFMWGKIGGVIIGIPMLIGMWALYWSICTRYSRKSIDYVQVPVLWGLFSVKKISHIESNDSNDVLAVWALLAVVTLIVSWIIIGCLIF